MIRSREEAAKAAEATTTNEVGRCQAVTRGWFNAPSAGDRDGDRDADAVDGWLSEPAEARHSDRNPPRGVPIAFNGGSKGYGHRAISLGGGKVRSTDMRGSSYAPGLTGDTTIDHIESAMGVRYLGWSETISGHQIPKPAKPKKDSLDRTVRIAHYSGLYSNTPEEWTTDAKKVFSRNYDWVTGTEAGERPNYRALKKVANAKGYKIRRFRSNWVAVKRTNIKRGTFRWGYKIIAKAGEVAGGGHDTCYVWATFQHKDAKIGKVTVAGAHYPTKGRPDAKEPLYRRNLRWTRLAAKMIGQLLGKKAEGKALGFYGGDQNIVDKSNDTFFGQPLTTCWDELKKYPKTHPKAGNIDVIATYDSDGRVACVGARAMDDSVMSLHADHFLIEATYRIKDKRA